MSTEPFIEFDGKRVLITGASSGIGRAISIMLSRHGASVILLGRDEERLMQTADVLESSDYHIICLDLQEHPKILPAIKKFSRETGTIYGFCHAAGIVETRPLSSCSVESLQSMLNVNLVSGVEIARAVCRRDIMEQDGGAILFISSIYSLIGMPGEIGYSASKGAVSSAARAMAIELARRKIRVNTLSPGLVHTNMTDASLSLLSETNVTELEQGHPLRTGTPEDVARAAAFMLAPQNSWITGADLVIDGGYSAR